MSDDPLGPRDARGRDALGLLEARCPHCGAPLYLAESPDARPICLNACTLPTWAYRLLLQGRAGAADAPGGAA